MDMVYSHHLCYNQITTCYIFFITSRLRDPCPSHHILLFKSQHKYPISLNTSHPIYYNILLYKHPILPLAHHNSTFPIPCITSHHKKPSHICFTSDPIHYTPSQTSNNMRYTINVPHHITLHSPHHTRPRHHIINLTSRP